MSIIGNKEIFNKKQIMLCFVKPQLRTADPLVKSCATISRMLQNKHRNVGAYNIYTSNLSVLIHYLTQLSLPWKPTGIYWILTQSVASKNSPCSSMKNCRSIKLLSPPRTPSGTSIPASHLPLSIQKQRVTVGNNCVHHRIKSLT